MTPEPLHFKLASFIRPGESYHFARLELISDYPARYHDHDFHELFWATHGRGEHLLNGRTYPLQGGRLVLVRPQDRHCVRGSDTAPLRVANLAFPSRSWKRIRRRYFPGEADPYDTSPPDRSWTLESRAQAELEMWAERLASTEGRPPVMLDGFLMSIPQLLQAPARAVDSGPQWLADARNAMTGPKEFAGGTLTLARLAGRSPSHVARVAVKYLGRTPTELVNDARMDYGARQLSETARPIMDIAMDSGVTNLSHFYALFRKRFGTSPRRFRLRAHSTIRG